MNGQRGSIWRKWDLHVHTPDSLVHHYGGADAWDKFIESLSKLPPEFKVLGINDYIFLDGYKKVVAAKAAGKLPNIDLLLPVIELRLDKFGGSKSGLSRVNFHVIFSNEIAPEIIESQFLSALCSKYVLTPMYDRLRTSGQWAAVPTRKSIEDLGRLIIESVPPEEREKFHSPIIEGFNNLCLSLSSVQDVLRSHYFDGKTLTAVGKTEWADIKWNDQSIADKKTIINGADLVFISSATAEEWANAQKSLKDAGVNDRLLDCSDAHHYADSANKDRLAKCFTWIKADPTFEGLRQTLYEPLSRVAVSTERPLEPLHTIRNVIFNFPDDTKLVNEVANEKQPNLFCFRGRTEITFSPYLTCLIGGRGSGKSTLLNLIHEKLDSGKTNFFKSNRLSPETTTSISSCVSIDGDTEQKEVEFLQQNEIEQFATSPLGFTDAIFSRLAKLDIDGKLSVMKTELLTAMLNANKQGKRIREYHELIAKIATTEKELTSAKNLIASFENEEYKAINSDLGKINHELKGLLNWRLRLEALINELGTLRETQKFPASINPNAYETEFFTILMAIEKLSAPVQERTNLTSAAEREKDLSLIVFGLKLQLGDFLKGRGLSPENMADVGKATERVAQYEQELPTLKMNQKELEAQIAAFKSAHLELTTKYSTIMETLLDPLNQTLSQLDKEVRPIELRYEFDKTQFEQTMVEYIKGQLGEKGLRNDHLSSLLDHVDFTALPPPDDFFAGLQGKQATAKLLRDHFSISPNFELLQLEAEKKLMDFESFGRIRVSYDGKPVENSSFGQRCTAAIVILLLLGNTPIVIDEPEAHLDSSLIANYLVELVKTAKLDRQIIFATHNANFVVNGDAELIHVLEMGADKITKIQSITIEDLAHRDKLLALEGGSEAFLKREHRYGIKP
jgi:ABC-type lipoprotein export system ATPase subunit